MIDSIEKHFAQEIIKKWIHSHEIINYVHHLYRFVVIGLVINIANAQVLVVQFLLFDSI